MENSIWINGHQLPFPDEAFFNTLEYTFYQELADRDWWKQCFGAYCWSEWSVVLRLRCMDLVQIIAGHPAEIVQVLSEIESPTLPHPMAAITQMLDSLENIVRAATGETISVWTTHSSRLSEAEAAFANISDESHLKTLIELPHIDRFLFGKQHEEKSVRKKTINARADFNRWKKRQGYR